ncbi:hypothetical protein TWF102_004703 [Orbilia oligospora]|uniref:Uncharacterized protein n=2 Tax=Orbilia oligospora TaxID=2813651 RepID=A0A7C8J8G1_ORBOL|nr:hypothetical protein TWF706_001535 [Orbilia oligospora]KAF3083017.1 hypothetical protein TWF103_003064 [Orbilia oligospora]KAF3101966.1 hypothetical protein TWF102_004703 [Orbilia oligospora]KAF3120351.1 hypothetical protein TWF594_003911 [Orbilia oligospora]
MTKQSSHSTPDPQDIFSAFFNTPAQEQSNSNPHQIQNLFSIQPPQPRVPKQNSIKMAILSRFFNRIKRQRSSDEKNTYTETTTPTTNVPHIVFPEPEKKPKTTASPPKTNSNSTKPKSSGGGGRSGGGSSGGTDPYNTLAVNSMLATSLSPDSSYSYGHHNNSNNHCSSSYSYSSGGGGGGGSSYSSGGDGGGSSSSGGDGGGSSSCGGF